MKSFAQRAAKISAAVLMIAVIVAALCCVLADMKRRRRSREVCVAVLYEDCIRCDNGVDHYRQTVKVESPADIERLELAPYAGGRMFVHIADNCRLADETVARLRDWATTNGLAEVSIVRSGATLRGTEKIAAQNGSSTWVVELGVGIRGVCEIGMTEEEVLSRCRFAYSDWKDDAAHAETNQSFVWFPSCGVYSFFSGKRGGARKCSAVNIVFKESQVADTASEDGHRNFSRVGIFSGTIPRFEPGERISWDAVFRRYGKHKVTAQTLMEYKGTEPLLLGSFDNYPIMIYRKLGVFFSGSRDEVTEMQLFAPVQ